MRQNSIAPTDSMTTAKSGLSSAITAVHGDIRYTQVVAPGVKATIHTYIGTCTRILMLLPLKAFGQIQVFTEFESSILDEQVLKNLSDWEMILQSTWFLFLRISQCIGYNLHLPIRGGILVVLYKTSHCIYLHYNKELAIEGGNTYDLHHP